MRPTSWVRACLIGARRKGAKDIRKGTVPAFLQSLLGDDRAHTVRGRQEILILGLLEVIAISRLDRDLRLVETCRQKPVADILCVDVVAVPVFRAGALNLDQHNGSDVAIFLGTEFARLIIQRV